MYLSTALSSLSGAVPHAQRAVAPRSDAQAELSDIGPNDMHLAGEDWRIKMTGDLKYVIPEMGCL